MMNEDTSRSGHVFQYTPYKSLRFQLLYNHAQCVQHLMKLEPEIYDNYIKIS